MPVITGLVELDKPKRVGHITNEQMLHGPSIPAIERLRFFSHDQFEDFILEWANDYLANKYLKVARCSGSGDKGRDIVAYIDLPGSANTRWDNYQCKHYDKKLSPSEFWVEIGKVCYFTHTGEYSIPEKYYLVTSNGIGPTLNDLFSDRNKMKREFINNWDGYCAKKIIKNETIPLTGALLAHAEEFNFNIFDWISELDIISQHKETRWHAARFGGGLIKPRPILEPIGDEIASQETRYVKQLFDAYAEHLGRPINTRLELCQDNELLSHFERQRVGYYSAAALKQFERDTLPDETVFENLKEEILYGVIDTCYLPAQDGYERVKKTVAMAQNVQVSSNPLSPCIRAHDRTGLCHHLANEDKLVWVKKK